MTDNQLADIMHQLGYKTDMRDVPVTVTIAHNRTDVALYPRLHVHNEGMWVEAQPFFEQLLDKSLINMIKSIN